MRPYNEGVAYEPISASSISADDGLGLFRSNVYIDTTKPGLQKPH